MDSNPLPVVSGLILLPVIYVVLSWNYQRVKRSPGQAT